MDGFALRVIAMAAMVTDHIGWYFIDDPMKLTWIGRIAFPIYAFLLAEGFLFVHSDRGRLKKHLTTMLLLAVVSEFAFDLMKFRLNTAEYLESQSNMITLLLGYLGMLVSELMLPSSEQDREKRSGTTAAALICAYALLGFANFMIKGNFNIVGPWLVIAYYWYLRKNKEALAAGKPRPWIKRFLILAGFFMIYLPIYFWVRSGFGNAARWWSEVTKYAPWIAGHLIAAGILSTYNGKQGYHRKWFKTLYTVFYPLHLFIIGLILIFTGK